MRIKRREVCLVRTQNRGTVAPQRRRRFAQSSRPFGIGTFRKVT
jgi:hypothetical protein